MKNKNQNEEKLPLKKTIGNIAYALKLGISFSPIIFINCIIINANEYFQWVFFSSVFMKRIVDALDHNEGFTNIFRYILICAAIIMSLSIYYFYYMNAVYPPETARVYKRIYTKLYNKAKNVELKCYEDADFYKKYTMAMDGADTKIIDVTKHFWGMISGAIATGFVFALMFEIDRFAVLFIICPLIGNFLFGNLKNKYEFKRYTEQASNNKILNYVNRAIYLPDYAKEIRLFPIFNLLKKQYSDATDDNVRIAGKYAFKNAHLNFWRITFTFSTIFEGILFYAIYKCLVMGTISLAQLTIMTSMMVSMTWILIGLFDDIVAIMRSGIYINNIRGFLEYKETIPENSDGIIPGEFEELEFCNVSFSYKDEETIKNLSFVIKKGEKAALVGHNGAGKTTIIKLLLRLYDPVSGVIKLNGRDIKEYNLHAYRDMFSTTFQDFALFGMTVKENVLMGRRISDDPAKENEVVIDALKKAGIYERVTKLSQGIDSMMTKEFDEEGAILSGGESQKLAVARTFAKQSPVKIFDEPSSALDPIAEYDLFKNIMKEGSHHTLLFISHRLSSVKDCDKIFMLEGGKLIEEGTHRKLMEDDKAYAKMYKHQAANYLAIDEKEVIA